MFERAEGREMPVATVRASCPSCGDVELTSWDLTVHVCAEDNRGSYSFRCPACELAVAKPADDKIVDLLLSSGVRLAVWHLPAELEEEHHGSVINYDDLLDFHYAIQQPGWFEQLITSGPRQDHP